MTFIFLKNYLVNQSLVWTLIFKKMSTFSSNAKIRNVSHSLQKDMKGIIKQLKKKKHCSRNINKEVTSRLYWFLLKHCL